MKILEAIAIAIYVAMAPIIAWLIGYNGSPEQWIIIVAWLFPLFVLVFAVMLKKEMTSCNVYGFSDNYGSGELSEKEFMRMYKEYKKKTKCAGR